MKKIKILGVQFDVCTKKEALKRVFDVLHSRMHEGGKQIVTPNPEMLLEAAHNKKFCDVLNNAWLSMADGIGVLWASTVQTKARHASAFMRALKGAYSLASLLLNPAYCTKVFPERITGVDLMEAICAESILQPKATAIFLLGAAHGIAEKVKEKLEKKYTGIKVVGTFSGSPSEYDFLPIEAAIAETRPDFLFVAYGSPAQEIWIAEHLSQLKSVKIAMGVGGAFDFIAEKRKRAPHFMQRMGIEWIYRLVQEPSRAKRIWNAAVRFPLKVLKKD